MGKNRWELLEGNLFLQKELQDRGPWANFSFKNKVMLLTLKNRRKILLFRLKIFKWRIIGPIKSHWSHLNHLFSQKEDWALKTQLKSIFSNQSKKKKLNIMKYSSMMNKISKQQPKYKNKRLMGTSQKRKMSSRNKGKWNSDLGIKTKIILMTTCLWWEIGKGKKSGIKLLITDRK